MRSRLQHLLNPLHIYCRLVSIGCPRCLALKIGGTVGQILRPVLYPSPCPRGPRSGATSSPAGGRTLTSREVSHVRD